jgi:hypothetical protein
MLKTDRQQPANRIPNAKPEGRRKRERHKMRWEDEIGNDVKASLCRF